MTSDGGAGNALETVALTDLGTVRGGVPVTMDQAPSWNAKTWGSPSVPNEVAMEGFTGNATSPARGGDTFTVTGTVANLSGPTANNVNVALEPARWVDRVFIHDDERRHARAGGVTTGELDGDDPRRRRPGQLLDRGDRELPAGIHDQYDRRRRTGSR